MTEILASDGSDFELILGKQLYYFYLLYATENRTTTTFKMVEALSLKNAFPFRIAQKSKKEVRNFASDPPAPFQSCCLTNSMSCAQVSNIEMGEEGERLVNI